MAEIKKINTELQLLDKFLDTSGNAGSANQVLVSTTTGISWVDGSGSGIIGGPYLPLSGGTMSGALNILIPGDPKLILQSTSGDTSDWNYINFVGRDTVRDGYIGTDADGDMQVYSDKNASSVQLTASGILLDGSNVGIGTTSPDVKLWVNDTADGDKIRWGKDDALVGSIGTYNGVPYIGYQGGAGGGIMFNGSSIEPTLLGNSRSTNTNDIGSTTYRWKDGWFAGNVTSPTFLGDLNGTINTATTAVTKANATNDTTVATTAFVQNLIGTIPAGLVFQGTWNAATNTPTLTSGAGTTGHFYIVSVDGTTNLDGVTDWKVGDWAVFVEQGASDQWEKVDNSSVLDGSGIGNQIAKWAGSGTSNTLTNSILEDNGSELVSAGKIILNNVAGDRKIQFNRTGGNSYSIEQDSASLYFYNTSTSEAPLLFQNDGDVIMNAGNVGIGTTAPTRRLTVSNPANGDVALFTNTADADLLVNLTSGVTLLTPSTGTLAFGTSLTERMRIDSAGNVGIGTTNPGAKLEVNTGSSAAYFTRTAGDNGVLNPVVAIAVDSNKGLVAASGSSLDFRVKAVGTANPLGGSTMMSITSTGNVGIGTTSPAGKLHVVGNILSQSGRVYTDALQGYFTNAITLGDGNNAYNIISRNSQNIGITGGNVGIGTIGPVAKLDVSRGSSGVVANFNGVNAYGAETGITLSEGRAKISGFLNTGGGTPGSNLRFYTMPDGGSVTERMRIDSSGDVSIIGGLLELGGEGISGGYLISEEGLFFNTDINNNGDGIIVFGQGRSRSLGGTEYMRINSAGNVGIGTTSPSTKLQVDGAGYSFIAGYDSGNRRVYIGLDPVGEPSIQGSLSNGTARQIAINPGGGNVGIGTTAPGYKLSIQGSAGIEQSEEYFYFNSTYSIGNNARGKIRAVGAGGGSGYGGDLRFSSRASNNVWNEDVLTIANTGNVGIGTTSPTAQLHIDSIVKIGIQYANPSILSFVDNGTPWWTIGRPALSGNFRISSYALNAVEIQPATGNVGIGTTSPGAKLSVDGVASMGGNSRLSMGILDINSAGTPTQILIQTTIPFNSGAADFTVNIKGFIYGSDESCNLSIHWHYYNSIPYNANITSSGSWAPIAKLHSSSSGFVQIHLSSPGYWPKIYVESMYSSAYNNAYASGWSWSDAAGTGTAYALDYKKDFGNNFVMTDPGNVGIGTSSPSEKLDVQGSINVSDANFFRYKGNTGIIGSATSITGESGASDKLGIRSANDILFATNGANERMRITSAGGVGIGTTSPDVPLDVQGAIQASESGGDFIRMQTDGTNNIFDVNSGAYVFRTSGFAERMRITSAGNVGIGTTSPKQKLIVEGTLATKPNGVDGYYSYLRSNWAEADAFELGISDNGETNFHKLITSSNYFYGSTLQFWTSDTEKMRIISNGNVGIGTTSPSQKLHVVGKGLFTDDIQLNQTSPRIDYGNTTTAGSLRFWSTNAGGEKMRIDSSGNVGIGTTSPKSKLDVNGHFCVGSKTHTVTDTFTTCLTVNLTNHTGCHVVITLFGDWSGHSSAAYRGEFFLQNGANSYAEPGIILRQDDNTSVGTDQIICQIVDPTSTANPKDFQIQIRHTDTTSPASWLGQLTYTVQGKFNSIT